MLIIHKCINFLWCYSKLPQTKYLKVTQIYCNSGDQKLKIGLVLLCVCVCVCVCVCALSHVWLFATLWTVDRQAPLSMKFPRLEYRSEFSFLTSGVLSWPRDQTCVSCIGRWILYCWATWETPKIGLSALKSFISGNSRVESVFWSFPVSSSYPHSFVHGAQPFSKPAMVDGVLLKLYLSDSDTLASLFHF